MKKLFKVIPAAILAFGAFTGMGISASASCHGRSNANSCHSSTAAKNYGWNSGNTSAATVNVQAKTRHYFIDSNNDGICDSCADGVCLSNGLCSSYFHDHGIFVDINHDGICDHYAAGVCGFHHLNGKFIDNNNDGICDSCAAGICSQHGTGLGHHSGHGCHR